MDNIRYFQSAGERLSSIAVLPGLTDSEVLLVLGNTPMVIPPRSRKPIVDLLRKDARNQHARILT